MAIALNVLPFYAANRKDLTRHSLAVNNSPVRKKSANVRKSKRLCSFLGWSSLVNSKAEKKRQNKIRRGRRQRPVRQRSKVVQWVGKLDENPTAIVTRILTSITRSQPTTRGTAKDGEGAIQWWQGASQQQEELVNDDKGAGKPWPKAANQVLAIYTYKSQIRNSKFWNYMAKPKFHLTPL